MLDKMGAEPLRMAVASLVTYCVSWLGLARPSGADGWH